MEIAIIAFLWVMGAFAVFLGFADTRKPSKLFLALLVWPFAILLAVVVATVGVLTEK